MEWKCRKSAHSPDKENQNSNWLKSKKVLNNVLFTMRLHSLTPNQTQRTPLSAAPQPTTKNQDFTLTNLVSDKTSLLPDEILLKILSKLPKSQRAANFLVSKRWLNLQGRLVRSVKLLDWEFLVTGRVFVRFPNLVHVDLVNGCLISSRNSGIFCTHKSLSFHLGSDVEGKDKFFDENLVLNADEIDRGLRVLASGCPNLRKLVVVNCSGMGLLSLSEECPTLQELDLLMCNDQVLRGIAACRNLQVLRLSGIVDGFYGSLVSDVGLTILAQGCKRLVKLELSGCKGSYEGIKAIGQCCQMLEELTLRNHSMEDEWLSALSFFENLRTLRFVSCKRIDASAELDEHLGSCPAVERLHLEKCQLRDKRSLRALFLVCHNTRKLVVRNCWGLHDDMFSTSSALRRVRFLSLEGCSLLTTHGLESVIISWNELQSLELKSCNNITDSEVNPALSTVFSALKDLKWKPDSKSLLSSNLEGTGMGKRGNKMMKGKGVAIESDQEEEGGLDYDHRNLEPKFALPFSTRNTSSRYDFVKVKVWLGESADHYYVLSRFLLSRMLTVTKIPNHVAIKIALELKKLLIDNSLLDVSQSDLEANLFKLMERRGYGDEYINRYKMMTRFHHQRVPLVILVCGTACVGKSTIATQLAQRLNLPNVLQTDMVYELLRTATDAPLTSSPVWARDFSSSEELITEFCRECRIVRKGLGGDLKKAMKDGKPIIIEGIHLDPSIYLMDDENKSSSTLPAKDEEKCLEKNKNGSSAENFAAPCGNEDTGNLCNQTARSGETVSGADMVSDALKSMEIGGSKPVCTGEKDAGMVETHKVKKEKSGPEPIIIPIILKMSQFDHKALLEEWLSSRINEKYPIQDRDKLIGNLKTIQDYLCSFKSQGYAVVTVSATTFPQTLDWLHNYLLQCIEQGTSPVSPRNGGQTVRNQVNK
ncbi:F-box protein [Sesamum alatum]|uniref:F-box protein n=1 Tax=Sesamum alatum TaxID=300844 RepID=A0AAE2CRM2_9LAMI|nr:F-box protein [Sesamum alatum]